MTSRRALLAILAVAGFAGLRQGRARAATDVELPTGEQPPKKDGRIDFFPLPLYATSPNEGSTYGVLPVWLAVDGSGNTRWIIAPSASWNSSSGVNATFRYYQIYSITHGWLLIASGSQTINRSFRFEYKNVPGYPAATTLEIQTIARKNIFYRFYGFGPDTTKDGVSSYTRELGLLSVRGGLNVLRNFNVGVRGGVRGDKPLQHTVQDLPATQDKYPGTPGLGGAAIGTVELSLRYDSRALGDYSRTSGLASELHGARDFGFDGGVSLWRGTWVTRALLRETERLMGGARLYWTDQTGGANVPFYYRSMLGGDTLFRGFPDDRFIDRGAWEAEVEQRILLFSLDWFGVRSDWRLDPFVAAGQVYPDFANMFSNVRIAGGAGLRAFVHPNILGRVDLAYSDDGFAAYVLLGYPY